MNALDVSVVVGFRDWGVGRIRRSVESILSAFDGITGEVIISDYGSLESAPSNQVASDLGVKYVYTAGDPVWSRSRALNAGFAVAEGALFISTDADMLFSPQSIRRIIEAAGEAENCALFLQCRDLPSHMGDEYFEKSSTIDWEALEVAGRLRPRWGMGGMMAIPAEGFATIRGFDERLHTYGGEDLDFAQRARRAGYRTVWIDDPQVRMYHMWHPPTLRVVEKTESGREAVEANRRVVYHDKTYARNLTEWRHPAGNQRPLVSVVYATKDRPVLLTESIRSVLMQSVQDFEIIVVDDGSEDEATEHAVRAFTDDRIRYFRQESQGISAARNLALDASAGLFTAVMDDDDLMPPRRLEWQLEAITEEYVGSTGSFVNFDNDTGELELIVSKVPTLAQAVDRGGAPGHGTWLIKTDVMKSIRYDDTIPSGVDNNFFLRLLRAGYNVAHCGKPTMLRRRHSAQVTEVDSSNQGDAAKQALQFLQFGLNGWNFSKLAEEAKNVGYPDIGERADLIRDVRPFLPDRLVRRNATVHLSRRVETWPAFDGKPMIQVLNREGEPLNSQITVINASYKDLVKLASLGSVLEAEIVDSTTDQQYHGSPWIADVLSDYLSRTPTGDVVQIFVSPEAASQGTAYSMDNGDSSESVVVTHEPEVSSMCPAPWLVVGSTVKEYWS